MPGMSPQQVGKAWAAQQALNEARLTNPQWQEVADKEFTRIMVGMFSDKALREMCDKANEHADKVCGIAQAQAQASSEESSTS